MFNKLMAFAIAKNVPIFLCENVMCRLCGCTGNNMSYVLLKETCYLVKMIQEETNVKIIENDLFPRTVCRVCVDKIHLIKHFKSHCKKTQKVMESTFNVLNKDSTNVIQQNENNLLKMQSDNDEEMIVEWLEEDFLNQNEIDQKNEQSSEMNSNNLERYEIIYEDVNTFPNIDIALCENTSKDDKVVPQKILGQVKKQRVRVYSKEELSKINEKKQLNLDKRVSSVKKKKRNQNSSMQVNINNSIGPLLYKLLSESNDSYNIKQIDNETFIEKSEETGVIISDELFLYYDQETEVPKAEEPVVKYELPADQRVDRSGRIFQSKAHKYVEKVSDKQYRCMICEKIFRYPFQTELHVRKHINEKPFVCEYCNKRFITGFYLMKHEKVHKNGQLICEVCGKNFRESYALKDHQRMHTDSAPSFKCKYCNKEFYTKNNYDGHKLIHGEKKHICEICGKQFSLFSMMKRHRNRHNSDIKYPCKICPKVLKTKEEMRQHLKRHERNGLFRCNTCSLSFWTKKGLRMHERVTHKFVNSKNYEFICGDMHSD